MRGIAVGLLLLTLASQARAEEDAKSLFERGTALFALRKFSAAAAAYEKAFELKPDPAILYNAAQAHRLAGNKVRALELYQSVVRLYAGKLPPRKGAEIGLHIRNLTQAIEAERAATGAPSQTPWPSTRVDEPEPKRAPPPPPSETLVAKTPERQPVTKKPWFWGVIGTVGALVVAGVVVGAVLGSQRTESPTPTFGRVEGD